MSNQIKGVGQKLGLILLGVAFALGFNALAQGQLLYRATAEEVRFGRFPLYSPQIWRIPVSETQSCFIYGEPQNPMGFSCTNK